MKVIIAGSTGLIGEALVRKIASEGGTAVRLVRDSRPHGEQGIAWDPASGTLDGSALDGADAIVCLSGESIAARWTRAKKERLRDSRVSSAGLIAKRVASMDSPPGVVIFASAIGYYGERGDAIVDETSAKGEGFLSDLCEAWEHASRPAADAGIRTVLLRLGVVLDPRGGLLKNVLPIFRAGLGGVIGNGRQYMSWISIEDVLGIIGFAMENHSLSGPINAVSPSPVTNREFTRALAGALHRPALLPVPAALIRLAMGEAGVNLALGSTRVVPGRLIEAGYGFIHPEIGSAFEELLHRD